VLLALPWQGDCRMRRISCTILFCSCCSSRTAGSCASLRTDRDGCKPSYAARMALDNGQTSLQQSFLTSLLALHQVTEVPLVFDDAAGSIAKTSAAVALLKKVSFETLFEHSNTKMRACGHALSCDSRPGCCSASLYHIADHQQIDTGSTFLSTSRLRNVSDTRLILANQVGAYADVEKAKASRNIRRGKGKMRNRRYVGRKGPLVVFGEEDGISKAFRNLPGVEVSSVDSLNLLQVRNLHISSHFCTQNARQ